MGPHVRSELLISHNLKQMNLLDFVVRIIKFLKENSKVWAGSLVRKQLRNNRICGCKYAIRSTALVLHVET